MKLKKIVIIGILLAITTVYAQPLPESGVFVGGSVTYKGERVNASELKVLISMPSKGFEKEAYVPPNPDLDYAFNPIKAEAGEQIVVKAEYKQKSTQDYIITEKNKSTYILNLELQDEDRKPPSTTTTVSTSTETTETTQAIFLQNSNLITYGMVIVALIVIIAVGLMYYENK